MFPEMKLRETSGLEGNKTNWFPAGPDIIFLDFHFNRNKRITGVNQNSRPGI